MENPQAQAPKCYSANTVFHFSKRTNLLIKASPKVSSNRSKCFTSEVSYSSRTTLDRNDIIGGASALCVCTCVEKLKCVSLLNRLFRTTTRTYVTWQTEPVVLTRCVLATFAQRWGSGSERKSVLARQRRLAWLCIAAGKELAVFSCLLASSLLYSSKFLRG